MPRPETRSAAGAAGVPAAMALAEHCAQVRQASLALIAPLSAEDCCVQSMPDASPVKWHLAHTTWFFETFVLASWEPGFVPFHPAFRVLFNSYYHGVGARHPRAQRGLITRPGLQQVLDYRRQVDARLLALFAGQQAPLAPQLPQLQALMELGLQHEQQHQELLLMDVKHLLSCNPLLPAYAGSNAHADADADARSDALVERAGAPPPPAMHWQPLAAGLREMGHSAQGFSFDNEGPRHAVYLSAFALASRPVCNAEYQAFVDAGGYAEPRHWLSDGWDWLQSEGRTCPLYWRRAEGGGWAEFTLYGLQALQPARPVVHLSYYEADAYARWAGARLPTEAEWECAVLECAPGRADGAGPALRLHPPPMKTPTVAPGVVWEWTQSAYAPYPGFRAAQGALGEYNGKFMVNQYVLRGGACVSPPGHVRPTYRNFFAASACWQFAGLRLARDG